MWLSRSETVALRDLIATRLRLRLLQWTRWGVIVSKLWCLILYHCNTVYGFTWICWKKCSILNWDWRDYSVCLLIFNTCWNGIVVPCKQRSIFWSQRDQINDYESCRIEELTKKWEMIWNNTRLVKSSCQLCIFAEQCEDKFEWRQVTGEVNVWRVSKRPWTSFNNLWSRMRLPSLGRMHFRDGWSLFCCEKMVRRNCDDRCLVVLTQSSYGFAMDSHVPIICSE